MSQYTQDESPYNQTPYNEIQNQPMNVFSIVALVLGVASLFLGLLGIITGIIGLIFGLISLNQIKRTHERGKGMAIAGTICSGLATVIYLGLTIIGFLAYYTNM